MVPVVGPGLVGSPRDPAVGSKPTPPLLALLVLAGTAVEDVPALPPDQLVPALLAEEEILPRSTEEPVPAVPADQLVLALAGSDRVVARVAAGNVPALKARDRVVAAVAHDHVGSRSADDRVARVRADDRRAFTTAPEDRLPVRGVGLRSEGGGQVDLPGSIGVHDDDLAGGVEPEGESDLRAVGGEGGRDLAGGRRLGQVHRAGPVGVPHPDVVAPRLVADEG